MNDVPVKCFIDSGNLTGKNAISYSLFRKLGFSKNNIKPTTHPIGTAKLQSSLDVIGRLNSKLIMKLGQSTYFCRPLVINDLSMDFNLSLSFLEKNGIDQLHSSGKLQLRGGELIDLVEYSPEPNPISFICPSNVYLKEDIKVSPASGVLVPLVSGEDFKRTDGQLYMVAGDTRTMLRKQVEMVSGVCDAAPDQPIMAFVVNRGSEPVVLSKNQKLGTIELVEDASNEINNQLASIGNAQNSETLVQQTSAEKWPETEDEKISWIEKHFKIQENGLLDPGQKKEVMELLLKYFSLFSDGNSFGRTTLVEHAIKLIPGTEPIRTKNRRQNPNLLPSLKEQLELWDREKIVETSTSPWAAQLVPVKKKNTNKIRWCCDYRLLNEKSIFDSYPLPNVQDLLDRIEKKSLFSSLDLASAYHSIPLRQQDKPKTAFSCPYGLFQFITLPFGLKGAVATFSRLIQQVLQDLPLEMVAYYLDDLLVMSQDVQTHVRDLEQVFEKLQTSGLKLQPSKCHFFTQVVDFLGHRVTPEGLQPNPDYAKLVKSWPQPETLKQVRGFLGKVGYYSRYIPNFNHIAGPLSDLLKNEAVPDSRRVVLNEQAKKAFENLRECLVTAPILGKPWFSTDPKETPFVLDTDWSAENGAVGAVLSQIQNGAEKVICYDSHKLRKHELNYSSHKGEMFAVLFFMKKFRHFLLHRPFILRIDNQALKWLKSQDPPSSLVSRWLSTLADYEFSIQYRPSKKHANADAMSRLTHVPDHTGADMEEFDDEILGAVVAVAPIDMAAKQQEDPCLAQVRKWVEDDKKPSYKDIRSQGTDLRLYLDVFETLYIDTNNVLMRRVITGEPFKIDRICVPKSLQEELVSMVHRMDQGHLRKDKTLDAVTHKYFFQTPTKVVEKVLNACEVCFLKQGAQKPQRHTHATVQEGYPFRKLCIDHVGPLRQSSRGNTYILTVKDTFSRFLLAFPCSSLETKETARILEVGIFSKYDLPEQIHADNHKTFTSDLMKHLGDTLGIKTTFTSSYNPKGNPVERVHKDLNKIIKALLIQNPGQDWEEVLPAACKALNTSRSSSTGLSPHFVLYGQEARTPLDIIYGRAPQPQSRGPIEYVNQLRDRLSEAYAFVRKNLQRSVERARMQYTKSQTGKFEVGKQVWLFTPRTDPAVGRKFTNYYTGPYTITRKISDVMYEISTDGHSGDWNKRHLALVVSIDRIQLYTGTSKPIQQDLSAEDLQTSDEFIESAVDVGYQPYDVRPTYPVQVTVPQEVEVISDAPAPKPNKPSNPSVKEIPVSNPVLPINEDIWELEPSTDVLDEEMPGPTTEVQKDDAPIAGRTRSKQARLRSDLDDFFDDTPASKRHHK